jgi:hypothetical protein
MALHLPLIWHDLHQHPASIRHHALPEMTTVHGLPLCAADQFTRVGKSCYRTLRKAIPELTGFTAQQIGLGQFYKEGGLVDKELTSPILDAIQQDGELTDIQGTGLAWSAYQDLRCLLSEHADVLAEIREHQLKRHFASLSAGGQK